MYESLGGLHQGNIQQGGHHARDLLNRNILEADLYPRDLHEKSFYDRDLRERGLDERDLYIREPRDESSYHVLPRRTDTRSPWLNVRDERGYGFAKRMDTPAALAAGDAINIKEWELGVLNLRPGEKSKIYKVTDKPDKAGEKLANKLAVGTAGVGTCTVLAIVGDHGAIMVHFTPHFCALMNGETKYRGEDIKKTFTDNAKRIVTKLEKAWKDNQKNVLSNPKLVFMPGPGQAAHNNIPDPAAAVRALLAKAKIPGQATPLPFVHTSGQSLNANSGTTIIIGAARNGPTGARPKLFLEGQEQHL